MIGMLAKGKFNGEQLKIITANSEHSLRTNLTTYSHKHKWHTIVYTQCIEMMPKLPGRMDCEEIEEALMEAAMEIMENADEDGELVVSNVMIDHAAELGIPSRLTPEDDEKNCGTG